MKYCTGCKEKKSFDKFYRDVSKKDKLSSRCISCKLISQKIYNKKETTVSRRKLYFKSDSYKASKRRYNQSERGKEKSRKQCLRYYYSIAGQKNYKKNLALGNYKHSKKSIFLDRKRTKSIGRDMVYRLVHAALKSGFLIRAGCVICGNKKTHAHHENYSKPLEVMWLCPKHHSIRHKELKNQKTREQNEART